MRSFFAAAVTSVLVVSSMAFAGCAVDTATDGGDDDSASAESAAALSAYGEKLVGSWKYQTGGAADFTWIVLKGDGTFFTEQQIFCIKAPCINPRTEGKFIGYKPTSGHSYGGLRLISKSGTQYYRVSLAGDGNGFKLSGDSGKSWAGFERLASFCETATDCKGQSYIHIMCVGHATCTSENTCGYKCGVEPVKCDYADPGRRYMGKYLDTCSRIKFACDFAAGEEFFSDSCGCGCTVPAPKPCVVGGCSGQICADESMISTCIWRPEYACYRTATCERDAAGTCGWTKTAELTACLASAGT
jgi:hypothetical protein